MHGKIFYVVCAMQKMMFGFSKNKKKLEKRDIRMMVTCMPHCMMAKNFYGMGVILYLLALLT